MNVRLKYSTVFTSGIYYGNQLIMNTYRASFNMLTGDCNGEDHNVALERLKFFIHNQIASGIFINQTNKKICQDLFGAGIKVITLPEEPVDQVIGIMLHSKLNAIMEDRLLITDVELASELGDNIWYVHSDDENQGPMDQAGWWQESDTSYCDLNLMIDQKIINLQPKQSWDDLDLNWSEQKTVAQDNKLVFADFSKDETR